MAKIEGWQTDLGKKGIDILVGKGHLNNPEDWKKKLADDSQNWLLFTLLGRIVKDSLPLGSQPSTPQGQQWYTYNASAYSYASEDPLAGSQWGDKTAIGTNVRVGVIAVPRGHMLFKKKVEIKFPSGWTHKDGIYTAEDTFGAGTTGNRIDVFMTTGAECIQFGRRDVQLRIIGDM